MYIQHLCNPEALGRVPDCVALFVRTLFQSLANHDCEQREVFAKNTASIGLSRRE